MQHLTISVADTVCTKFLDLILLSETARDIKPSSITIAENSWNVTPRGAARDLKGEEEVETDSVTFCFIY